MNGFVYPQTVIAFALDTPSHRENPSYIFIMAGLPEREPISLISGFASGCRLHEGLE